MLEESNTQLKGTKVTKSSKKKFKMPECHQKTSKIVLEKV